MLDTSFLELIDEGFCCSFSEASVELIILQQSRRSKGSLDAMM